MQPLQAPGLVDGRYGVSLDQAAADDLVSGDLPSDAEQGRDVVGRAGTASWDTPADGVADQAEADGGDGGDETGKPKLAGRIEVDDADLGGERNGGKRGRGAAGKTPFVAAVETTPDRRPKRLRLTVVAGFRKKIVEDMASHNFAVGGHVVSDGLRCWAAAEKAGCRHFPMATGGGAKSAKWAPFKWVNTTLGTIKTALAGTYHHVSAKHAQRYLASFASRFNRRFQLDTLAERLARACARTEPHPYRIITAG